jgi:hypothetical protein
MPDKRKHRSWRIAPSVSSSNPTIFRLPIDVDQRLRIGLLNSPEASRDCRGNSGAIAFVSDDVLAVGFCFDSFYATGRSK